MDAHFTTTEINNYREILQGDSSAQKALAILEQHNGRINDSLDELLSEAVGQMKAYDLARLRQVTLKQLRQEICANDTFRTKVQEYNKTPESGSLLTGLIAYLVGLVSTGGTPLDPAIASVVVLYILKIGLDSFCEYTESSVTDPQSRRIPHD